MKAHAIRKVFGGAVLVFGFWWIWIAFVRPFISFDEGNPDGGDYVFRYAILPLMAIPGVLAAVFGFRLIREASEGNLKGIVGIAAVFLALWISPKIEENVLSALPVSVRGIAALFAGTLIAIAVYLLAVCYFLRRMKIADRKLRSLAGKGVFLILAWQLWLLLSQVFEAYSPKREPDGRISIEPWLFLSLIVPIAVAVIFYKAGCWWSARQQEPRGL